MNPLLQIREYTPKDYPMLCEWWMGHKAPCVRKDALPKLGVIVEELKADGFPTPIAASFLYMDNSVGVCFLKHAVSQPELGLKKSRQAFKVAVAFLKESAASMDYGIMISYTYPGIARILQGCGFEQGNTGLVELVASTR